MRTPGEVGKARKEYRRATGVISLSLPLFRLVATLWLLSIMALAFVSYASPISGLKSWVLDVSIHGVIFLALALVPGLCVRSKSTLVAAAFVIVSLAVGIETAQAVF